MMLGFKLTVVPVGAPVAVKFTALLKPPPTAVVMVDVPCVPCTSVKVRAMPTRSGWAVRQLRLDSLSPGAECHHRKRSL